MRHKIAGTRLSRSTGARKALFKNLLTDLFRNERIETTEVKAKVIRSRGQKPGETRLDLVKKDGLWCVRERNDYPANFSEISSFLLKAADLKAAQTEEIGPSQLGRYKLLPPGPATNTAILVELRDQGGKVIKSLLLGKSHMRKAESRPSPSER